AEESDRLHEPVMVAEVVGLLSAHAPILFVDATVGTGGHCAALLRATGARMLGLDRDGDALAAAAERLAEFGDRVMLRQANFTELDDVMADCGISHADAIFADFGMSSFALDDPQRGFSFRQDGPLDMRMDRRDTVRAYDLVNEESEPELARILHEYGEERASRRIARMIVDARRRGPIETTGDLRAIVERALGAHRRGAVSPATRTFQALRIAVNHEVECLASLLTRGPALLSAGGRMATIAYHSLEDRPVKERFRELGRGAQYKLLTPKAIKPTGAELSRNPRARSARLRCIERTAQ
ncbi:MAG: 16S rRNA (cytosine(1402)-N(4))-methyltransferase RsmH, partial [Candidatus Binataceae bacterium]